MKKIVIVSCCVVLLFFSMLYGIGTYKHAVESTFVEKVRPDGVYDIKDFLQRFPEQERTFQSDVDGHRYVVVWISTPKVAGHISSGPPAYVFDSDGALVDWSADIGDDGKIWEKWLLASARELKESEFNLYLDQFSRGNSGIEAPIQEP
jgi:hypothetical protein